MVFAKKPHDPAWEEEAITKYMERHDEEARRHDLTIFKMVGLPLSEIQVGGPEDLLYSGIILRDQSLKSKLEDVTIEFNLPLDRL
jgi:hypothetical protein